METGNYDMEKRIPTEQMALGYNVPIMAVDSTSPSLNVHI